MVSGNTKIKGEEIVRIFEKKVINRIMIFETKSIFLAHLEEGNKEVLESFPLVGKIQSRQSFPDKISVDIVERKPVTVFCNNETVVIIEESGEESYMENEKCFSLDNEGIVFEENLDYQGLIKIKMDDFKDFVFGDQIIDKDTIGKLLKIEDLFSSDLKIETEQYYIFSERLNIKTKEGWEAYLTLIGDIDWQLKKLKAVIDVKLPLGERKNIKYIELRFGNLAPYY